MNNFFDIKSFFSGIVANILTAIILGILGLIIFDRERSKLRPWIFRFFGEKFSRYLYKFLNAIINPWFRIFIILFLLLLINYNNGSILFSVIVFLIILTFNNKPKFQNFFSPAPEISDGFLNLENWFIKNGEPIIENNFGKPAPDLGLQAISGDRMNSFVILNNIERDAGIIEFDFYLEKGALINLVILADIKEEKWYMVRFDSRKEYSDGFIIKDSGPGINWKDCSLSGTQTSADEWHRARVEFDSSKISMYKDGILLVEIANPILFGKKIGLFNELNKVHVDNFYFIEK